MIRPSAARSHVDTLAEYLKERLAHHRRDTLRRVAEVLFGIFQAESTLHRKIALHIDREATPASITRMVARTFHETNLTPQDVTDVLLPLLPPGKLTFVMDRTTWKLGSHDLNVLVLGVSLGGIVLPLTWNVLPHGGNSDMRARMLLVGLLLKRLPAQRWAVLIADREFIGQEWFNFLRDRKIKRCIRIRENTLPDDESARDHFQALKPGEVRGVFERVWVYGSRMQVVATLPAGRARSGGLRFVLLGHLDHLPAPVEDRKHLLCDENAGSEPRTHSYDSTRPPFAPLRPAQPGAGVDGPRWGMAS